MSWVCPNCNREYRNKNQWHSCVKVDINVHLENKPQNIVDTVQKLISEISKFGSIEISPIKTAIQFRKGATFLSIRVKKDRCELEFQLPFDVEEFSIVKKVRVSSKRVYYLVYIDSVEDVDNQLLSWIKEAYKLIIDI
jgi:predicted transport protein